MRIWGLLGTASMGACSLVTPLDGYSSGSSGSGSSPEGAGSEIAIDGGVLPDGAPAGDGATIADAEPAPPVDEGALATGLVLHHAFDEGAGDVAADLSGKGHVASLVGGATWGAGAPGRGTALYLNGSGAYASVKWTSALDVTERFTIAAWVRLGATSYNQRVAGHHDAWEIKLNGRQPQLDLGEDYVMIGTSVPVDTWVHLAFVYDRGAIVGYVDGAAHPVQDPPRATSIPPGDHSVRIGAYSGTTPTQFMNGAIDEFRIYDRALSAAEVALLARR